MAILFRPPSSGSHWYTRDGQPMHQINDGKGVRNVHVGDARPAGWLPSVTNYLGILDKPGLNKWAKGQVALAAFRQPPTPTESEDYFVERVMGQAYEQVDDAADLGVTIHHSLEDAIKRILAGQSVMDSGGEVDDKLKPYCLPFLGWMYGKGIKPLEAETTIVNTEHGYAGRGDLPAQGPKLPVFIDYKTRRTEPGKQVYARDGQATQIAAYGMTYFKGQPFAGANVFISSTEPGRTVVITYTPERMLAEWQFFRAVMACWRHLKEYDPRIRTVVTGAGPFLPPTGKREDGPLPQPVPEVPPGGAVTGNPFSPTSATASPAPAPVASTTSTATPVADVPDPRAHALVHLYCTPDKGIYWHEERVDGKFLCSMRAGLVPESTVELAKLTKRCGMTIDPALVKYDPKPRFITSDSPGPLFEKTAPKVVAPEPVRVEEPKPAKAKKRKK